MEELDQKIEQLRQRKTGVINRDDVIFILTTLRDVRSTVDGFTQVVKHSMDKKMASTQGSQQSTGIEIDNNETDEIVTDDNEGTQEYVCFNCGDVNDKPLDFCRACHAGLKWKK